MILKKISFSTAVLLGFSLQPVYAVFSHAWEMGHSAQKWRWTMDDLLAKSGKIKDFPAERILLPCWGEMIKYKR